MKIAEETQKAGILLIAKLTVIFYIDIVKRNYNEYLLQMLGFFAVQTDCGNNNCLTYCTFCFFLETEGWKL